MTMRKRGEAFLVMPDLEMQLGYDAPSSYPQDGIQYAMSCITCLLLAFSAFSVGFLLAMIFGVFDSEQDTYLSLPHNFSNSTSLPLYPQTGSHKLLGFVGVQTSFSSVDRRAALRSTWFPSNSDTHLSLEQDTRLAFRFVIGRSKDAKEMADLEEEIKRYSDFLLIDVKEDYLNLPKQTLAFFKAAYDQFEADYYVKVCDNIYLRPDRLATLLAKERTDPMTYIGCIDPMTYIGSMKRGQVITDPKMIWFEKSRGSMATENFLYGYGSIYVLSKEIVAALAVAKNNSLRMFSNEDVSVGLWMLAMNVNHEDNQALCDPQCTPTSIAIGDFLGCSGLWNPVNRLKELHNISMCSKSPTLPSDDRKHLRGMLPDIKRASKNGRERVNSYNWFLNPL